MRSRLPKKREEIAAITKMVVECAEQGCGVSIEILKENALEIRKTIERLAEKIEKVNPKIVINGGITHSKALWESALQGVGVLQYTNDAIDMALKEIAENI